MDQGGSRSLSLPRRASGVMGHGVQFSAATSLKHGREHRHHLRHLWRVAMLCVRFIVRTCALARSLPQLLLSEKALIAQRLEERGHCIRAQHEAAGFVQSFGQRLSGDELAGLLRRVSFTEGRALSLRQLHRLMLFLKRRHLLECATSEAEEAFRALQQDLPGSAAAGGTSCDAPPPPLPDEQQRPLTEARLQAAVSAFGLRLPDDVRGGPDRVVDFAHFARMVGDGDVGAVAAQRQRRNSRAAAPLMRWAAAMGQPRGVAAKRGAAASGGGGSGAGASTIVSPTRSMSLEGSFLGESTRLRRRNSQSVRHAVATTRSPPSEFGFGRPLVPLGDSGTRRAGAAPPAKALPSMRPAAESSFTSSTADALDVEVEVEAMQHDLARITAPPPPRLVRRAASVDPVAHREAFPVLGRGERWTLQRVAHRIDLLDAASATDHPRHAASRNVRYCDDARRPQMLGEIRPSDIARLDCTPPRLVESHRAPPMGRMGGAAMRRRLPAAPPRRPRSTPVQELFAQHPGLARRREVLMESVRSSCNASAQVGPSGVLPPEVRAAIVQRRLAGARAKDAAPLEPPVRALAQLALARMQAVPPSPSPSGGEAPARAPSAMAPVPVTVGVPAWGSAL